MATDFPSLRASLAPERAAASNQELKALVKRVYGPKVTAKTAERIVGIWLEQLASKRAGARAGADST